MSLSRTPSSGDGVTKQGRSSLGSWTALFSHCCLPASSPHSCAHLLGCSLQRLAFYSFSKPVAWRPPTLDLHAYQPLYLPDKHLLLQGAVQGHLSVELAASLPLAVPWAPALPVACSSCAPSCRCESVSAHPTGPLAQETVSLSEQNLAHCYLTAKYRYL